MILGKSLPWVVVDWSLRLQLLHTTSTRKVSRWYNFTEKHMPIWLHRKDWRYEGNFSLISNWHLYIKYKYIYISLFSITPIDIYNSSGSRCFTYSHDTFKPRNSDRKCRQSPVGRNFWYTRHAAGFTAITWNRASWCRTPDPPKLMLCIWFFPVSKETFFGWNILGFKYKLLYMLLRAPTVSLPFLCEVHN